MRVGLVTLGCDKNTVDNEYLAGLLDKAGCEVVAADGPDVASLPAGPFDTVVVTTCGFIADAKEQSVEVLVELAERKRLEGNPRRIFVAGCLSQRYAADLVREIPEIDALVGVGQFEELTALITEAKPLGKRSHVHATPKVDVCRPIPRLSLGKKPYAFLKIADGCNHTCTFCAIPAMKGRYRSVAPDILLAEARALLKRGVRELALVAQDISAYGSDRKGRYRLPNLLRDLDSLPGDFWIRCLYCYPAGITDELLNVVALSRHIVPYLDIPLQHFDRDILKHMKRPGAGIDADRIIQRIRQAVPGVVLRTTLIVGFPGETPRAHKEMLDAVERLRFERLGAFVFSPEEDTPAAQMPRQVGDHTKQKRFHAVMNVQAEVSADFNETRVGSHVKVLIEEAGETPGTWIARSAAEAPEVDGCIHVSSSKPLKAGDFVTAEITQADIYDVVGRVVDA